MLPTSFIPSVALSLVFVDPGEHVDLGNVIPVPSTSSRPAFALKPVDIEVPAGIPTRTLKPNQTLTLVLSDPDATSRSDPVKGQMCHWIATGIRAPPAYHQADVADGVTYTGRRVVGEPSPSGPYHYKELIKYMQPAPPPKTGSHRYVFVLLAPKSGSGGDTGLKKPSERPHFGYGEMGKGIMDWAEDNGLEPIGEWDLLVRALAKP